MYDWILENQLTPHILVDASVWGVNVPEQHVKGGQMVLNVEPRAVRDFDLNSDKMTFDARFDGQTCKVVVPIKAVLSIFAQENGCGQWFSERDEKLSSVGPRLAGHRPTGLSDTDVDVVEDASQHERSHESEKETKKWFGKKQDKKEKTEP